MIIEVGVSDEFESKMREYDENFEFSNFNSSYINDQRDSDARQDVINIFKHYFGTDLFRKVFLPKEREPLVITKLEKVKVEDSGEGQTNTEFENTGNNPPMEQVNFIR